METMKNSERTIYDSSFPSFRVRKIWMLKDLQKEQSIEFAKKQQSVTYLVFSTEDAELVGYFAITMKPITVNAESF